MKPLPSNPHLGQRLIAAVLPSYYGPLQIVAKPESPPATQQNWVGPRFEPENLTQNATYIRIQTALREAENGMTRNLFAFYRDVLLSDDHIQGCFNTRKIATLAQPMALLPFDKTNQDDTAACATIKRMVSDCESWTRALAGLLDSTLWPVKVAEKLFRPVKPGENDGQDIPLQFTLKKLSPVNYQQLCYQWAYLTGGIGMGSETPVQQAAIEGPHAGRAGQPPVGNFMIDLEIWEPYIKLWPIDESGRLIYDATRALYLDPERHLVHRGHLLSEDIRDNWGGPMRSLLPWYFLRTVGRDWFGRFMQRFGSPFPVAKVNVEDEQAIEFMRTALSLATSIGGLVIGHEDEVSLESAVVQGGAEGHKLFHDTCNNAIARSITGQDMQAGGGAKGGLSNNLENLKSEVRQDYRILDQLLLGETLAKLFHQCLDINGQPGRPPKPVFGGLSSDQVAATGALLVQLSQSDLEIADDDLPIVSERIGLRVQRRAAPDAGSPDKPVFDPDQDIVSQREIWRRNNLQKKSETATLSASESGHWITVGGEHIFLKDTLTDTTKNDTLTKGTDEDSDRRRAIKGSPESAAHDTGRGTETVPGHDASAPERAARIAVEQQRLRDWAKDNGKLKGKLPPEDTRGGEHIVHFDEDSQRVIKATRPEAFHGYGLSYGSYSQGATPSEYLDRISQQNRLFGDDVRIERIVPSQGKLSIVTSQPMIKGRDASQDEIDSYMAGKGFRKIGPSAYHSEGENILVHDLVPKNAKVGASGIVHPIDPAIQRVTPDFASDLEKYSMVRLSASDSDSAFSLQPSAFEDLIRRSSPKLATQFTASRAPILAILQASASPEDFEGRLAEYLSNDSAAKISTLVEDTLQMAAALGSASAAI